MTQAGTYAGTGNRHHLNAMTGGHYFPAPVEGCYIVRLRQELAADADTLRRSASCVLTPAASAPATPQHHDGTAQPLRLLLRAQDCHSPQNRAQLRTGRAGRLPYWKAKPQAAPAQAPCTSYVPTTAAAMAATPQHAHRLPVLEGSGAAALRTDAGTQ